ncbi:MAG: hypothetical protein KKH04_18505 [Proteobacteria bacterium]|nr:hypothetical protein [Pseudomonadota bacterium]
MLFGKKLGLFVIEVKDWTSQQIISHDPHQFTIRVLEKTEQKINPDKQAKGYVTEPPVCHEPRDIYRH